MSDYFAFENFFSDDELAVFERAIKKNEPGNNNTPLHGPFANQLVANYVQIDSDLESMNLLKLRLSQITGIFNVSDDFDIKYHISCFMRVKLFLPWDVHNDLPITPLPPGHSPLYNMLIPLHDVNSRTILFEQKSDLFKDFYLYKKHHSIVETPIDKKFWDENLSMCWDEDRFYLTLLAELPYQRRGQLLGMMQSQYHSSDNFHTKGITQKDFIQIRVDAKS